VEGSHRRSRVRQLNPEIIGIDGRMTLNERITARVKVCR
jgi:hypothetical protein